MPDRNTRGSEKVEEPGFGRYAFLGDSSVRLVGSSLSPIVTDIISYGHGPIISDVFVGLADASGWRPARPGDYSWAWLARRSIRPTSVGTMAIVIGLRQPASDVDALKLLRSHLIQGSRLFTFTLDLLPEKFDAYGHGFTGGVFVAT